MSVISLVMWIITALAGLFLLAIWLIEYDPDFQTASATRLPIPVISGHVLLAAGGLVTWIAYLITDMRLLAYLTLGDLALVFCLGLTMAIRWIGVYQSRSLPPRPASWAKAVPAEASAVLRSRGGLFEPRQPQLATAGARAGAGASAELAVPPERHFPVTVVVGHGLLAVTTVTLVLLTTLGAFGS